MMADPLLPSPPSTLASAAYELVSSKRVLPSPPYNSHPPRATAWPVETRRTAITMIFMPKVVPPLAAPWSHHAGRRQRLTSCLRPREVSAYAGPTVALGGRDTRR